MNVEQFWSHNSKQITSRFSWFMQIRCIYNLMQITMAGTFFMMRFWTHLMLLFHANHHGTKVFVKPFFSEFTANHHGRNVLHVWISSTSEAIARSIWIHVSMHLAYAYAYVYVVGPNERGSEEVNMYMYMHMHMYMYMHMHMHMYM